MTDLWSYGAFSLVIVLAAGGLLAWHMRAWREAQRAHLDPAELQYRRRQYRRRMQSSAMLGLLGVGIFIGAAAMYFRAPPLAVTLYWLVVLLVLAWLALLALADAVATKYHYARLRDQNLIEEAKMRAELQRMQSHRGNGEARKK
jgi:hypothetical protein